MAVFVSKNYSQLELCHRRASLWIPLPHSSRACAAQRSTRYYTPTPTPMGAMLILGLPITEPEPESDVSTPRTHWHGVVWIVIRFGTQIGINHAPSLLTIKVMCRRSTGCEKSTHFGQIYFDLLHCQTTPWAPAILSNNLGLVGYPLRPTQLWHDWLLAD